jgi:ATP-dependent Zn protease
MSVEERERQAQARKKGQEQERREYWELLIEGARDGQEKTRLLFDQRQENLYRRLEELNIRDEIREQGRTTRIWLALLTVSVLTLILIVIFVSLWF